MIPPVIRAIFSGEPGVGKSSVVRRLTTGEFTEKYLRTLQVNVYTIKHEFKGRLLHIGLRDPQGHRTSLDTIRTYMRNSHVLFLIYDISRPYTLYELGFRTTFFLSSSGKKPVILIGNKKDLREEYEDAVSPEEGEKFANHLSEILDIEVPYIEISAKTGENVDKIIPVALLMLSKYLGLRR